MTTTYEKVTYDVMISMPEGTMSEEFEEFKGGPKTRVDLGGTRPFMPGYRKPEHTADTVARAWEYVRSLTPDGQVWVEKVTETITREKINV